MTCQNNCLCSIGAGYQCICGATCRCSGPGCGTAKNLGQNPNYEGLFQHFKSKGKSDDEARKLRDELFASRQDDAIGEPLETTGEDTLSAQPPVSPVPPPSPRPSNPNPAGSKIGVRSGSCCLKNPDPERPDGTKPETSRRLF
ncbi:hypothetical protein TWF730_010650 [Orbilia blumenaviensis]|uniref:Tesmin/TSO1-like CXC domain-containing protein n=1 Tax=Orbilia blumenaviensis TaxID=1796055 RepID=A0AAV9UTA2_9PEZI